MKDVIELLTDGYDSTSTKDRIEQGRKILFDFDYPIFDETYRVDFETRFIRKFYMREIGFETEGLFKFNLETWLTIEMPYWNKMYESTLLAYDPLKNNSTHTSHTQTNTGSNTNSSTTGNDITDTTTGTNFNRNLESNNPDSRLTITANNGTGIIEYASSINEDSSNDSSTRTSHSGGNNSSNGTVNASETFSQDRSGKIGVQTYAKMIQEHRGALINVDEQVFKKMNELFMLVY
jgi:hypothetical protein